MNNLFPSIRGGAKAAVIVWLGVIVVAVLTAAILHFGGQFLRKSLSDEQKVENIEDGWKTYKSSDGIFSFKVPSDWIWVYTDDDSLSGEKRFYQVAFADKSYADTGVARINFGAAWLREPDIVDEADLQNFLKEEYKVAGKEIVLEKTTLAGLAAYRRTIQEEGEEVTQIATIRKGLIFIVTYFIKNDSAKDFQLISEIIDSFEIIK